MDPSTRVLGMDSSQQTALSASNMLMGILGGPSDINDEIGRLAQEDVTETVRYVPI